METTVGHRLREIAGDWGLTSTNVIGHDVQLGFGNSVDNIAERFLDSLVIEYHFEGTSLYGDFDWSSVRLRVRRHEAVPDRPAGWLCSQSCRTPGRPEPLYRTLGPGGRLRSVLGCRYDTEPLAS